MFRKMIIPISLFLALFALVTTASAVQKIPMSRDHWTCTDYSLDYQISHPDFGILTLSHNPLFRGVSHMVNYKIINNGKTLLIHDGLKNSDYRFDGWYKSDDYYHFWINGEKPVRTYSFLRDNSDIVLKQYDITDRL
jgi:hypothetical protein